MIARYRPEFRLVMSLLLTAFLVNAPAASAQTEQQVDAIHTAEQQHRSPVELATMWAQQAYQYHPRDFLKAENAYNHALHLLKDVPEAQPRYAETLDNLAALYLMYGRVDEAEVVRKQSLAIRRQLGNLADIGVGEVHIADIAIARRQYKKAEKFAMQGMKDMALTPNPPPVGMLSALITATYAKSLQGHAGEALSTAQQAFNFAGTHFEPDTPAIGFALQTLGYAQWKNGDPEEGGKTMQRGLVILRSKLAPTDRRLAGALMQYEDYLVTTRHRPEADAIRDEVSRMNTGAGPACPGCTVSVYSLAKGLR
jgi:tetratricopeptide (TPR) repeat protein